ncbi:hypothetical protein L873DRAFT_1755854 [Choiromyces venosus 120613-1]|uniref:Uncharacterized protein n=1 Tax=Choiromyces venosus 120613-1 TaxID=1336337 RepID=A0A3N4J4G8_9PEZI|nr:hypothetical protein L873DRAFT_1755854 [Choiromyces venosus 120613-1]
MVLDDNYIHKGYHNKQPKQFIRTLRTMGHEKADSDRKKGRCKATTEDSRIGIQEANFTSRLNGMFHFCYCNKANMLLMVA